MHRLLLSLWMVGASAFAQEAKPVAPLTRAHAHNDYEHPRPLLDALAHGFCGVEADVWLIDGRLLVAHDRKDARPERTLETLYLDPLRARLAQHGGRVYRGGPTLLLLIDVKSDATNTYRALGGVLARYEEMLTVFRAEITVTNAVTVVLSGNRARALMAGEPTRLAAYDGRLDDLESGGSAHFIPLISDNWTRTFQWRGAGPFPDEEKLKLRELVARTHRQGRQLRLWGTPDTRAVWSELWAAGADWINTDDLRGFREFYPAK